MTKAAQAERGPSARGSAARIASVGASPGCRTCTASAGAGRSGPIGAGADFRSPSVPLSRYRSTSPDR